MAAARLPQTLRTERLRLRAFNASDAAALARIAGVYSVARNTWGIPLPYSPAAAAAWISDLVEREAAGLERIFAITLGEPSSSELCGAVGLTLESEHARAELGYWLGENFRGHGYAREAVSCVLAQAFAELGLARIYAHCITDNRASLNLLEALGFEREGLLRGHICKDDTRLDVFVYGLLKAPTAHFLAL